jgi:hypothetical protein
MEISSMNESNLIDKNQQSKMINNTENKENIILICFDPNNQLKDLKKQMNQLNNNILCYSELESCIIFIQSIEKQKIFLITSDSSASQLLSHININYIFIFSLDNIQCEGSIINNSKIIGIYDDLHILCSSIQQQINLIQQQNHIWCFFDQNDCANRDLSKQANHFLWIQLFHHVLFNYLLKIYLFNKSFLKHYKHKT